MDFSNRSKITRFTRKVVFGYDENTPKARKLKLVHRTVNGKQNDVQTFECEGVTEDGIGTLVADMDATLIDDAEGMGGVQQYVLLAIGEGGDVFARLTLRCAVDAEDDEDSVSSEPATLKGVLTQFMRHNEAKDRAMISSLGIIMRAQQSMIETQSTMIEKYSARDLEMITTREELMSKKHERDMEIEGKRQDGELKGEFLQKFLGLVPTIAKKLLGASLGGDVPIEIHELRAMYANMSDAEREALRSALSPERFIALMSLVEQDLEKQVNEATKNGAREAH